MMSNYKHIRDAIREIEEAFDREITRWYRIRRQAIRRGYNDLANRIIEEIHFAKSQRTAMHLFDWPYGYKYLFQLDRPAHHYH